MPDTQNAFAVPSPALQQARPARPSQSDKARQTQQPGQARPSHKHTNKEYDAAKDDGQENAFASFMALLNQASGQEGQEGQADDKPVSFNANGLLFSDGQDDTRENDAGKDAVTGVPAVKNVKQALPKPILDLMVSLKSGLEEKQLSADALSEEMSGILSELGNDAPDWDLKALEAMLSRLRDGQTVQTMVPESDEPQDLETKVQKPDYPKSGLETPPDGSIDDAGQEEAAEEPEELGKVPVEPGNLKSEPQAVWYTAPAEGQSDETAGTEQPQLMAVSKFHSYLKPDVPKETSPAQDAKPAEKQAGRNASAETAAAPSNPETKPAGDLSANLSGQGEQGEKQPSSGQRRDADRSVPEREAAAASPEKGVDEPKPRTNFTENRTAFEQFFDNVMSRRDTPSASAAPQLELARGSSFSQAETMREGLENVVRFIRANGEQKANLIVDPPALGRISVELTSSSTGLEASVKVSSEQIRQLIQDHLTQLKLSLEQQGVQLTHFSVDVQQDNDRRNQGQNQGNRRRRAAGAAGVDEEDTLGEEALFQVDLNQGLLYWVA